MGKIIRRTIIVLITLLGSVVLFAYQSPDTNSAQPDNTKINQRDKNQNAATADQQKENQSDRELARQIRKSVVQDKSLSTNAHNVKIIAQNGAVTLKGPVNSAEEKQAIEAKAAQVAGADKVTSELQVAQK
jgi:hyperosmotically inducible periplasmic protein